MFKNYLRVALRHLLRHRGYSAINVAGLTVGLACCLLIFQYVAFEYSFDRFHAHEADLYRVNTVMTRQGEEPSEDGPEAGAFTPHGMAPALAEAVPELRHVARAHPEYGAAVVSTPAHPERVFQEEEVFYVDPAFLEMFTFPLVQGDAAALANPGSALVTETFARKYFGDASPVGQVLDVSGQVDGTFRVAGVLEDVPANSHLRFDLLLPMSALLAGEGYSLPESFWGWNNFATYVQLQPGADRAAAERKMTGVLSANFPEMFRAEGLIPRVLTQPLSDIHLNDAIEGPSGPGGTVLGSYRTVYFFTVIGLVTLIIALVNYVNLATARAMDRAREVGVRKAVGAERQQLVVQFLFESALTVAVAALLAVVLAAALTPVVNALAETRLSLALWADAGFWAAFLGTLLTATLLAGLYPAFALSSFRPATALKGKMGAFTGQLWLRRGLVVLQFAATVVLIGGTAVVLDQLSYMRQMDLGLDLEQILTVESPRVLPEGMDDDAALARYGTLIEELRRLPAVRQVASSAKVPGEGFNWNGASVRRAEDDPTTAIRGVATYIDTTFASVYGMELVASEGPASFTPWPDSTEWPIALIPNETAVKALGFASPQEALGHPIVIGDSEARIVGVFKDFNWSSAHTERENVFFGRTEGGNYLSLRMSTADLPATLAEVERLYTELFPGNVFRYAFADEVFDKQYRADQRFATLFAFFAALAIGIACLGLLGLAAFTAQQRTKEIGVRKVLGASVVDVVVLLSKDFLRLVVAAVLIASPVAYFLMRGWLENFAYRVELGPWMFLLAGGLALLLALATVSTQALRAASADPVKALRYE
jgi:putative ABC transport system permease protein